MLVALVLGGFLDKLLHHPKTILALAWHSGDKVRDVIQSMRNQGRQGHEDNKITSNQVHLLSGQGDLANSKPTALGPLGW